MIEVVKLSSINSTKMPLELYIIVFFKTSFGVNTHWKKLLMIIYEVDSCVGC